MSRRPTILASAGAVLAWAAAAVAEPPCLDDVRKFCADTPAAGGNIQRCLREHEAKLSSPCKKNLDEIGRRVGPLVQACRYDIVQYCSDVAPGGGRIATCLQAKRDQLTPDCKEAMSTRNP